MSSELSQCRLLQVTWGCLVHNTIFKKHTVWHLVLIQAFLEPCVHCVIWFWPTLSMWFWPTLSMCNGSMWAEKVYYK